MDNNFESLLKTDNAVENTSQSSDDVLKYSKIKIKGICKALCLAASRYDPSRTVSAIENYLKEKASRERILYSEISSFVYGLSADEQGNFATNVECLLTFAVDENNDVDEDTCKIIIKIYDHFQLAVNQKNLNADTNDMIKAHLVESINEAKDSINQAAKNAKNIEKEYITILGIFASVVLAFVGGLTFSTSVLQHVNAISIYRLLLVVDLIAAVLINVIYLLMRFICHINDKQVKVFRIKWFNIVFGIIAILIVAAWIVDFSSLVDFINSYLPWTK